MRKIIITITDAQKNNFYDLEVPAETTFDKLKTDIVDTLNGYVPGLKIQAKNVVFISNRTGRQLEEHETPESAGVWNGDYITIIEV